MAFVFDPKDGDAAPFSAVLSYYPQFYDCGMVNVYPYFLASGMIVKQNIEADGPAPNWEKNIKLVPIPQIEGILRNDFQDFDFQTVTPEEKFRLVFEAAKTWTESFQKAGLHVFAVNLSLAGIGERYDIATGKAVDAHGEPIAEAGALQKYFEDRIMIALFRYYEEEHPEIPRIGTVRAFDVAERGKRFKWASDGRPAPWGAAYDFHAAMATPAIHFGKYNFNMYIADRVPFCLAQEAKYRAGAELTLTSDNPTANLIVGNIN